jgi:hypothetical protein
MNVSSWIQMKTQIFGSGDLRDGFLTLGSATNNEGKALRFRAVGVSSELNGRVQFHAHLEELDAIGVVACMVACEKSELPQKVMVIARVEQGRIAGLGQTDLQGSEVMGILGGVINEFVLLIDPLVPIAKPAAKSRGKRNGANPIRPAPVKNDEPANGEPESDAAAAVPQEAGLNLTIPPEVAVERREEILVGKGEIPPLHDRVEVLNPEALESFPHTSGRIPILDDPVEEKVPTPTKGKKNKQLQQTDSPREKSNGANGGHSIDAQSDQEDASKSGIDHNGAFDSSVKIDSSLMLKGENGDEIADNEMLF